MSARVRVCMQCGEVKELAAFRERRSRCRDCTNAEARENHVPQAPPKAACELMASAQLTASERMLVFRCVAEIRVFQRGLEEQLRAKARKQPIGRPRSGATRVSGCEIVLGGVHWRRQITLMSCAISLAKEQGVHFTHALSGAFAKRILAEGA